MVLGHFVSFCPHKVVKSIRIRYDSIREKKTRLNSIQTSLKKRYLYQVDIFFFLFLLVDSYYSKKKLKTPLFSCNLAKKKLRGTFLVNLFIVLDKYIYKSFLTHMNFNDCVIFVIKTTIFTDKP